MIKSAIYYNGSFDIRISKIGDMMNARSYRIAASVSETSCLDDEMT